MLFLLAGLFLPLAPININGHGRQLKGQWSALIFLKRKRFLYRFCTADSAFEPFLLFRLFGESITYMLSTLLHSSIPTSSSARPVTAILRGSRAPFKPADPYVEASLQHMDSVYDFRNFM
jgi:hypothetical protein